MNEYTAYNMGGARILKLRDKGQGTEGQYFLCGPNVDHYIQLLQSPWSRCQRWQSLPKAKTLCFWTRQKLQIWYLEMQKVTNVSVVLQKWCLISHTLACVWLPEGTLLPSKFLLEGSWVGKMHGWEPGRAAVPYLSPLYRHSWLSCELAPLI